MARRATSLGPKPSLLFFLVLFCFLVFFEGFKGQVRWPDGPPHLALNPPYLLFLFGGGCFFLSFLCFFMPRSLPLFQFLFLCLSLIRFLFSSFLSFFFAFFWLLLFVSFFPFFLLCFCFMEGTTSKHSIGICFHQYFLFVLVSCLAFSFESSFLMFAFFPDFKLCFLFNMNVLVSRQTT